MRSRLVLSSNTAWSLVNYRSGLIRALDERNFRIFTLAPEDRFESTLRGMKCEVHSIAIDNRGTNPLRDIRTLHAYYRAYRAIKPAVALHFTIKPVIYGTLAAKWLGIPCINMITGLGSTFIKDDWITRIAQRLYRQSKLWPHVVFFQNPDDQSLFVDRGLVSPRAAQRLPGSGVDLEHFSVSELPRSERPIFLLISRLLWDKGIGEFVQAARMVKESRPTVRFAILGPRMGTAPSAVPAELLSSWCREGTVEYFGETADVRPFIRDATCIVLPSFYREGIPRSLLEAAAMGRPVITTDTPGCRDAVEHGVTGFLCRAKDTADLARKITDLALLPHDARAEMGRLGHMKMKGSFDHRIVIKKYLTAIDQILGRWAPATAVL